VFFDEGWVYVNGSWLTPRKQDGRGYRKSVKNRVLHEVPLPRSLMADELLPRVRHLLGLPDSATLQQVTNAQQANAIDAHHNIMKGYYKQLGATADAIRDGWFRSGDLARKDEDGFFYIVDRSKDMIIRGGYNVYPRELDEVLIQHRAVSPAAVIGVPHPSHGEEIKAVLVRTAGDTTTGDELLAWGTEQFASYKYPRIVQFVDALPMTSTGKVRKRDLT
jgi:acyl-CoA synthetase (AMP-forming)/AMP-acid ligase II